MTIHLVKLCVGATSADDLKNWQAPRIGRSVSRGIACFAHATFQTPKRQDELLDGGSLFWVIKGVIDVRQRIVGFETGTKDDGSSCCVILLDPAIVPVRPVPRRPFQGWRYLTATDAPADMSATASAQDVASLSAKMRRDLADLGLL